MSWSMHPATLLSAGYRDAWDHLNEKSNGSHPLLATEFVVPLIECMGGDHVVLAVRDTRGKVSGLALLERSATGVWQTFMPSQGCLCPILLDAQADVSNSMIASELLAALPGRPWLLGFLKLDPRYSVLPAVPGHELVEHVRHGTTTSVTARNFDEFWATRSRSLRTGISRKLRRLKRDGIGHEVRMIDDPGAIGAAVAAHGVLESRGWKGDAGTSIHPDNLQGELYDRIMLGFARRRQAQVYQLLFDGSLTASLMTIRRNRMLVVLKTAYDESWKKYAPGRLLDYLMMQLVFNDRDTSSIENYTSASSADLEWCTDKREIFHLNVFSSLLARNAVTAVRKLRHLVWLPGRTRAVVQ